MNAQEIIRELNEFGFNICDFVTDTDHESLFSTCGALEEARNNATIMQVRHVRRRFMVHSNVGDARLLPENILPETELLWVDIVGAIFCLAFVALLALMFLGYLTLDELDLRVIARASIDEDQRAAATKIIPIMEHKHRTLVTILIVNSLAYETLPLFMDALMPVWLNVVLSTSLILLFGEIIPSGIATGPRQLAIAATLLPAMKFLLWVTYPVSFPLTKLLDYLVHNGEPAKDEGYNRMEMSALVRIQQELALPEAAKRAATVGPFHQKINQWSDLKAELLEKTGADDDESVSIMVEQMAPPLTDLEVEIVEGALSMKTTLAFDIYTPLNKMYAIPETTVLDKDTMCRIYSQGYSRIPVYRPNPDDPNDKTAVLGFLLTRQLMLIDWDHNRSVESLHLQKPVCVSPRINCVDLLQLLQNNGPILTFVTTVPDLANAAFRAGQPIPPHAGLLGLVTLEDLMECLIQDRIYDELDIRDRDHAVNTLTKWAVLKLQNFYRKKKGKLSLSIRNQQPVTLQQTTNETTSLLSHRQNSYN